MLDERQYRENQPCGDAIALPCSSWDRRRTILGRRQFNWLKRQLSVRTPPGRSSPGSRS